MAGHGLELAAQIAMVLGQGQGTAERVEGFGAAALRVIAGVAQGQCQRDAQMRGRADLLFEQRECLAHMATVLLGQ